jgi:hypothetical protein
MVSKAMTQRTSTGRILGLDALELGAWGTEFLASTERNKRSASRRFGVTLTLEGTTDGRED